MSHGLEDSGTSEQRRVSYTSLDSQTMAAARAAADAAGLTLEEWLSRTILDNARRSGIIPGQGGGHGNTQSREQSVNAITRHLRSAQAAADAAGISVAEWLSRTILENTRRAAARPADEGGAAPASGAPAPVTGVPATGVPETGVPGTSVPSTGIPETPVPEAPGRLTVPPPAATAPQPDGPSARAASTRAAVASMEETEDSHGAPPQDIPPPGAEGRSEVVEERFAQVVATWRQELEEAEMAAERERADAERRRGNTLVLTQDLEEKPARRRGGMPWVAGTGIVVFGLVAALIWALPHLPKPRSGDDDPAMGRLGGSPAAGATGTAPATGTSTPPPTKYLNRVRASEMPTPAEKYVDWYRKAADAGNAEAQYVLATLYIQGNGVEQSLEKAAALFRRAAAEGNLAKAQYALGVLHARGKGVKKDDVEAVLRYRQAADQGYVPAITEVGLAFLHGRGVKKDLTRARTFLERAAEAGEVNAQYTLGRIYQRGIGVPQDNVTALKWFILAAEQKHRLAAQQVEDLSIGMRREQQDRATEMAREHNRRFPAKKKPQ